MPRGRKTAERSLPLPFPTGQRAPGRIEDRFDVPFVASLALREKQIQQNHRPIIAVHKWFARRPGTLYRALLLAEFGDQPLRDAFYEAHDFAGRRVADPFMGGGTPLLEANRVGCDVVGCDVNPMAWWVVRQELAALDLDAFREALTRIEAELRRSVDTLYATRCATCGGDARVKYFLWMKVETCGGCGDEVPLSPGWLVAKAVRHPKYVIVCACCGALQERESPEKLGRCSACREALRVEGNTARGAVTCPRCHHATPYLRDREAPPGHRLFAIEYHCVVCQSTRAGRFFKAPDADDHTRVAASRARWAQVSPRFVPDDVIPMGDETARLHRWGYRRWRELFNTRQLLGLETLCTLVDAEPDGAVHEALATTVSDLLRYQNLLCRYDTMALKSLDVFSVHGFPVGLVQCESNLPGLRGGATGNIGSGGWSNITSKFAAAKAYCDAPFELRGKQKVPVAERIGPRGAAPSERARDITVRCESSTTSVLVPASLDAVFTDPPYLANVQYAELMDFCYAWLRRLARGHEEMAAQTTRGTGDLTANKTQGRGVAEFTAGLSAVFCRTAAALKPGAPLAFTYHHNALEAYLPLAVALLDARFVVTAVPPCPCEMGGSIHIHGTDSSIVDTVFVCRTTGSMDAGTLATDAASLLARVGDDLARLKEGGVAVTRGDARCLVYGHAIRAVVWRLRARWNATATWEEKLALTRAETEAVEAIAAVQCTMKQIPTRRRGVGDRVTSYEISF